MTGKIKKISESVPVRSESPSPFQEIERRLRDMESRFENLFTDKWLQPSQWELPDWARMGALELKAPKVDIVDRDDDVLIRADLPGVKKDNVEVSLTDNTLTLKGSTSEEKKEEKGDYFRSETMKGSFSRTMSLPSDVDGSKAKATFRDGVLEIVVPKHVKAKRHTLKIS